MLVRPWYRPTRINHVISGAEFGWRNGTGKWPAYYPDSFARRCRYRPRLTHRDLFRVRHQLSKEVPGRVVHLRLELWQHPRRPFDTRRQHLRRHLRNICHRGAAAGHRHRRRIPTAPCTSRSVAAARRVPCTGFVIPASRQRTRPKGRRCKSRRTASAASQDRSDAHRRTLGSESSLGLGESGPRRSSDPFCGQNCVGTPAGRSLARQSGRPERFRGSHPWRDRSGTKRSRRVTKAAAIAALTPLPWDTLTSSQRIDLLRAYGLIAVRLGKITGDERQAILDQIADKFPSQDNEVDRELAQMLVYLASPESIAKIVAEMRNSPSQENQIHYAMALRGAKQGWNRDLHRQYFQWFNDIQSARGGMSFGGFIENIKKAALERVPQRVKRTSPRSSIRPGRPITQPSSLNDRWFKNGPSMTWPIRSSTALDALILSAAKKCLLPANATSAIAWGYKAASLAPTSRRLGAVSARRTCWCRSSNPAKRSATSMGRRSS